MIVSVAGLQSGADLSASVVRDGSFRLESAAGRRMDTAHFTLHDPAGTLAVPDRAEVVIYDAPAGGSVTDPTWAVSAYNTHLNGAGHEVTSPTAANWTPRLFAGYVATPKYFLEGAERYVEVAAQDYTVRLRTTVANIAFASGVTDQTQIKQVFAKYRPDFDTSQVQQVAANLPALSYPAHTLEQFMERIFKVTRAPYRVDYFKRMTYAAAGSLVAPLNFSDAPNYTSTFPTEGIEYTPDGSGLANTVWVIGQTYLSNVQQYTVPAALVNGTTYQFPLPGNPDTTGLAIKINGADQGTIGVAPGDGDVATPSSFKYNAVIQHTPAMVAFKTPPANGATVVVTAKFRYPLLQKISNPQLISATGGIIFEAIVRDRRITDLTLAQQVGTAFLLNQGQSLKGGRLTTRYRGLNNTLLQPGMQVNITNRKLFAGGVVKDSNGNPTTTAVVIITSVTTTMDDDTAQPYSVEVTFADRSVGGGY